MSNYTINLRVENGNLYSSCNSLTADSINYVIAKFSFDESWNGFTKTAIFRLGELVYHTVLENDECIVPHEVLTAPIMHVSVFGVLNDVQATTTEIPIQIKKSGYVACEPKTPTPDPYNYFVETVTKLKEEAVQAAESCSDYARELNPSNYYTKSEIDSKLAALTSTLTALGRRE